MIAPVAFLLLLGQVTSFQAGEPPRDTLAQKGSASEGQGRTNEGSVLIFPEDAQKWDESSRLIRTARPDASGGFEFRNVIPGDYLAVPLEYVRQGDWADPDFLRNLKERATRVRVGDAGVSGLALTLKKSQL